MRLSPRRPREGRDATDNARRWMPIALVVGAAVVAIGAVTYAWRSRSTPAPQAAEEAEPSPKEPLPYVNYAPVRPEQQGKSGTTVWQKDRAYSGFNLYVQKPDAAAILIDMGGEVVHRWSSSEGLAEHPLDRWRGWFTVRMTSTGDLYVVIDHKALLKLDWSSKLLWKADIAAHHEVVIADDGDAYTIAGDLRLVEIAGKKRLIEDNTIDVVSPTGEVKRKISSFDLFSANDELKKQLEDVTKRHFAKVDRDGLESSLKKADRGEAPRLQKLMDTGTLEGTDLYERFLLTRLPPSPMCDVFHANALTLLKDHPAGLWKAGDILISYRYMSLLVAFDPATNKAKWIWGPGEVYGQHQPSITPNGHVLLFDNGTWRPGAGGGGKKKRGRGAKRGGQKYSRLVELDPVTKQIVWTYEADPRQTFYSPGSGTAELLPNDDILTSEEDGRAFEVTRSKEVVWEYYNPKFDSTGKRRSGMYRMERLGPDVVEKLLRGPAP